jgi:hypothetical protein
VKCAVVKTDQTLRIGSHDVISTRCTTAVAAVEQHCHWHRPDALEECESIRLEWKSEVFHQRESLRSG